MILENTRQLLSSCWDGKARMAGDLAAVGVDSLAALPLVGGLAPDTEDARTWTNNLIGADPDEEASNDLNYPLGTILGGAAGMIGGPAGALVGATLGSAALGWFSETLDYVAGDPRARRVATKSPRASTPGPDGGP